MCHLLYLMFRCDRGCDGKFEKFGNFVGTKHTHGGLVQMPGACVNYAKSLHRMWHQSYGPCLVFFAQYLCVWWWVVVARNRMV